MTVTVSCSSVVSFSVIDCDDEAVVNDVGEIVVVFEVVPEAPLDTNPYAVTCNGNPVEEVVAVTTKLLPAVGVVLGAFSVSVVGAPVSYIVIPFKLVLAPLVSVTATDSEYVSAAPVVVGADSVKKLTASWTVAPPGIRTPPELPAE